MTVFWLCEKWDLIRALSASLSRDFPHFHMCTLALLASLPAYLRQPNLLLEVIQRSMRLQPTESLEHTNRDND